VPALYEPEDLSVFERFLEARRLASEFGIGAGGFAVVLIGKDGGQKLRVNDVPDLQAVYAMVDGMPMRGQEMSADPGRC